MPRMILVCLCLFLAACSRYPQDTPESVLASARQMVAEGRAERLTDLIYAENERMRDLLDQVGGLLGSLEDLAAAVQKAYPEEIAKLRTDAEEAAKNGEATGFLQRMAGQMVQPRRRGRNQPPGGDPDEARRTFDNAMKELFADPYGWLQRSEERLSVQTIADDTAAILWDGKPIFGVGLMMKQEGGKWYVVLPGVSGVLPKKDEGWEILGAVVQVFDQLFVDLAADVKSGKCKRLDDLAHAAGEKAFLPAVMVFFAYGKYMEAERPPRPDRPSRRAAPAGPG